MTFQTFRSKAGLLMDSNILTLYIVGLYDVKRIAEFKRTKGFYSPDDFYLLKNFIALFDNRLVTTPHILAEVSNLLEGTRYQYGPLLNSLTTFINIVQEIHIPSKEVVRQHPLLFTRFGLSDMVAGELVKQDYVLLTDDLDFSAYLRNKNMSVINFNNIRFNSLY
ncbi:PIN domain-containing protein [Spirosoma arcticum]